MKAWIVLFFGVMALFVVGCGGSGGGGSAQQVTFAQGVYAGTWTSTNSWNGTSTIDIEPDGQFSGSFYNQTLDINGTIQGQIVNDGSFEGTITLDGDDYDGNGVFELSNNDQTMTGHMTYQSITFNFNLTNTP